MLGKKMIEARAEIEIRATPEQVWSYIVRLDDWWLRSNPNEHVELSLIDADKIDEGTRFVLKEYIAGVKGEAIAEIKSLIPMQKVVWESNQATYKLFGATFNVDEGGVFELVNNGNTCVLSHHVWGKPKLPLVGWLAEIFFKYVLKGEQKDYEHTYRELQFVKKEIEAQYA